MNTNPFTTMLDYFGPNGEHWTQGRLVTTDGQRRCLIGAMNYTTLVQETQNYLKARRIILDVLNDVEATYRVAAFGDRVAAFNDRHTTTFDDIRVVCEKAQAKWEEQT